MHEVEVERGVDVPLQHVRNPAQTAPGAFGREQVSVDADGDGVGRLPEVRLEPVAVQRRTAQLERALILRRRAGRIRRSWLLLIS